MVDPSSIHARVGDRLDETRRRRFVGRERHRALFRSMLDGGDTTPVLLYIYGPGGIGKSTLLDCLIRDARDHGVRVVKLDGRTTAATPAAILHELGAGLSISPHADPFEEMRNTGQTALIIDTYEYFAPVDAWVHDELIASLPNGVVTVIAGRTPPSEERRSDAGWNELAAFVPLRNLGPDEVQHYLELRNVPADVHERVLDFTHGHPLALSMVADIVVQEGGSTEGIAFDRPDLIHVLVERLIRNEPDRERLRALEIAAQARFTTVDLLGSVLEDGHEQAHFQWLRSLSFMEQGPFGLFPHDLARDVIERDLRWRSPDQAWSDHQKIRSWYVRIIQSGQAGERHRASFDILYLHRNQPAMRPLVEWSVTGSAWLEPAKPEDLAYCRALAGALEGARSADLVDYWFARQPEGFAIAHAGGQRRLGFLAAVTLADDRSDVEHDPVAAAIWAWVDRHGPLRSGERIRISRFATPDPAQSPEQFVGMAAMWSMTDWLMTPDAGWSFVVSPFPEMVGDALQYGRFNVCGSDVTECDPPVRIYGHDWRAEPQALWFEQMTRKELGSADDVPVQGSVPLLVLSEAEFRTAVRDALRHINRPGRLTSNPLLQSRLVLQRGEATPATLQRLVREAAATLGQEPRDRRFAVAMERGYLNPAETHELAAESLDLPYSTFRLHLTTAVQRVTDYLWDLELQSVDF